LSRPVASADFTKAVVRPARKNDAVALGAFFIRAWKEAGPGALGFTGATDEAVKTISSKEFLTKRLSSPNTRIVIAEEGREVVGFASIRATGKREGELSGVVVLESASGVGLGSKLVRKACEAAAKMGLDHLSVKTEAFNQKAINFYKRNEFTESGKTTEKVGRVKIPLMVLEKTIRRRHNQ
jgi:N-acetylglutamate synthase-like GNAT family acetyltransferase